jgi:hypothetical protein
MVFNKY